MKALNVTTGTKYELTYIPIYWTCPNCNTDNDITLIEEEDLNHSQTNKATCRKCKMSIDIEASQIFNINFK